MKPGHFMVRDPFTYAREIRAPDDTPLARAMASLLKRLGKTGKVPLVASPCDREKHVIDSHAGGPCEACNRDVWISPSSVESMRKHDTVVLCMRCIEEAAEAKP